MPESFPEYADCQRIAGHQSGRRWKAPPAERNHRQESADCTYNQELTAMKVDIPAASFKCSRINLKRHRTAAWHLLCLIGCILTACTLHFVVLLAFPNTPFFPALLLLIAFISVFVYTYLYRETRPTR
jgi:hypothetical protein